MALYVTYHMNLLATENVIISSIKRYKKKIGVLKCPTSPRSPLHVCVYV